VLGLVVTDDLLVAHPDANEGQLAKLRSRVVCAPTLALVAAELGVGPALRLGRGEELSGGRTKSSILADAVEALFGAVWLDGGLDAASRVVRGRMAPHLVAAAAERGDTDFKTRLQEVAAREGAGVPDYRIVEEGPDHAKQFTATVRLSDRPWGVGSGRSKKEAEQAAAADALGRFVDGGGSERDRGRGEANA
jgi:ribonuclease III